MTVTIIGPRNRPRAGVINTTSHGTSFERGLSPFFLGPVDCYPRPGTVGTITARNVENAWQFSKVYQEHLVPGTDEIDPAWFVWRDQGFADPRAHRYPMGKGRVPLFSLWAGDRLSYIEARKRIYIPLYTKAVRDTEAFAHLRGLYQKTGTVTLFDFDGYLHRELGMDFEAVINDPTRKMGHAFVLAMMLEGYEGLDALLK